MACACSGPCGCGTPRFTKLDATAYNRTLGRRLICLADSLRDLNTQFGLRPYIVSIIRTRWSQGSRGEGIEIVTYEAPILPTPKLVDLSGLTEIVQPVGLDEVGGVTVTEISGRYTDDQLRGLSSDGTPPEAGEQVWWEVQFISPAGEAAERRRFIVRGAPSYQPERFQWEVRLERAHQNRARDGGVR